MLEQKQQLREYSVQLLHLSRVSWHTIVEDIQVDIEMMKEAEGWELVGHWLLDALAAFG
jgi:hypothetical protein